MQASEDFEREGAAPWRDLDRTGRLSALGLCFLIGTIFAVAWALEPDPRGLGTHEQLGLGACRMLSYFKIPCAFCGMTTTFSLMMHGGFGAGFANQPAGALVFAASVLAFLGSSGAAVLGKVPRSIGFQLLRPRAVVACIGVVTLSWIYKIVVHLS